MTAVNDILNWFESVAPLDSAMEYDNVGVLVGSKTAAVSRVLVTLDITKEVVLEAQNLGCELIISHHPVIFNPLKRLDSESVVYLLAQGGISAVCMHTNLDLSESFGVNLCLARALKLNSVKKSDKGECLFTGELDTTMNIRDFAKFVKQALNCEGVRYTDFLGEIKRVALCSGAGGSEIFAAAAEGADVLVTGEIKHHEINAANELSVAVVDAGHFKTEDVVTAELVKVLSEIFPETKFTKSAVYSDKIKYLQ